MRPEREETVLVHVRSIGEAHYRDGKYTERPWVSLYLDGHSTARHRDGVHELLANLECDGRVNLHLDLSDAARLRDKLSDALLQAGYVPEPQTETVG